MRILEKLKYYTLEKPFIFIFYILIGGGIILYYLGLKSVPIYESFSGTVYVQDGQYMLVSENAIDLEEAKKLYIYSSDLSERVIVTDFVQSDNAIYWESNENKFEDDSAVNCRIECGEERLIHKVFVNGGK